MKIYSTGLRVQISEEDEALIRRIEFPQDLEDGLLAVEYDQANARLAGAIREGLCKVIAGAMHDSCKGA